MVTAGGSRTQDAGGLTPEPVVAERSYRFVRASMVGLLLALALAVGYQSVRQHGLLDSISAYYYTPAQAIFVGALIGLGVAMIALRGTTDVEDVLLNLGGMLAPVIAVVPTSRGADFEAAVRACRGSGLTAMTGRAAAPLDCPTVASLTAATRDNVQNNMFALLVTGALGLVATAVFARMDRTAPRAFRWGLAASAVLYLAGLVAFLASSDWFIHHAHYISAAGLFVAIVAVVVVNAVRLTGERGRGAAGLRAMARQGGRWYLYLAVVMVGAAVLLGILVLVGAITLFWLEAALIGLFAVFWIAQTWEQWRSRLP